MFIPVGTVVHPPMQAGVVSAITIPGLHDVDLAVCGPCEGLKWQQPEGRPYPTCTRTRDDSGQYSFVSCQPLARHEAGGSELVGWIRVVVGGDSSQYEFPILCVKGVLWIGCVVLNLTVSPAIIVSLFRIPFLQNRLVCLEAGLPVYMVDWLLRRL